MKNLLLILSVWIVFQTPSGNKVFINPNSVDVVRSKDGVHNSENFSEIVLYGGETVNVTSSPTEVIKKFKEVEEVK